METKPDFSNSAYLFPHINKEGLPFGLIAVAIALADLLAAAFLHSFTLTALALPLALLAYGVFLFFRDPERYPPTDDPKAVLSPADGRICLIQDVPLPEELKPEETSLEDWNKETFTRVSVFMSVFNVHVNRMPTAGTIVRKAYVPGKYLNASLDKASKDNERCAFVFDHYAPCPDIKSASNHKEMREFAQKNGLRFHFDTHCGVCHRLDQHEHIRRGASADARHRVKESFRHFFEQAEGTAEVSDLFHFFRAHLRAAAGGCHTGSHKRRRVGHKTNETDLFAQHLLIVGDASASNDTYDELVLREYIPDLVKHIIQELRFHTKEQDLRLRSRFPVVSGHVYAVQ